jgi:DNA-binding PadR family transcriptional regulator
MMLRKLSSKIGISLALRRLTARRFLVEAWVEDQDGRLKGAKITDLGWDWISANEDSFVLRRPQRESRSELPTEFTDDEIRF